MAESSNLKKTNLSQQDSSNPAFDSLLKKAKKYLDKDQIQILFNLGVIGLVLDSQISEKKIINKFNDNLVNLNTDKKKSNSVPDLSSNLSSSPIEDDFDD